MSGKSTPAQAYDVLGIGFGPSNLAVAVAMDEANYRGRTLFLEQNIDRPWQAGMMLDGSDIQHNPLRDLITPVNPRSRYSFVSYLHASGRFFDYLNVGAAYPLRKEFASYIDWVKREFLPLVENEKATRIEVDKTGARPVWKVLTESGQEYAAHSVVVGTGRKENLPDIPGLSECTDAVHLSNYLYRIADKSAKDPIVVVGASQSAAEITLDLLKRGFTNISVVHRSFSFQLKDTSPFTDEVYFPDFIDYYHRLPAASRQSLDGQLRRTNYSSVDRDILDAVYRELYEDKLDNRRRLTIHRNFQLSAVSAAPHGHQLDVQEIFTGEKRSLPFKLLIMATGFLDIGRNGRGAVPELLAPLSDAFLWEDTHLRMSRNYAAELKPAFKHWPKLYLNGLCESSHGFGDAGSFSLLSLRARDILADIRSQKAKEPNHAFEAAE